MAQAVERRLPAIYDALDSRNSKLALKLIASALQKQPKSQTLRVLKAVALQRSGKDEEGLQVCETVRREVPTDEQILNTMTIVYRRANRMKDMSAAFAAASAAHPRDEGLLRGVFISCVRDYDFAGQQQIASKLHKLVGPSDDYYIWWTIVAITLQAKAAQKGAASALPTEKLFQLAEVMTAKQAQKGSLHTYEQLSLYLDILKAQGKQQQALQLVEGPVGDAISMPAERRMLRASLHVALHQQGQAAALFKEALLDSPDDWVSLQHYLDCMLTQTTQVAGDESDPQGAEDHDPVNHGLSQVHDHHQAALQKAEDTLQQLLTKIKSDPRLKGDAARGVIRGPQLAQVELELRRLTYTKQGRNGKEEKEQQKREAAIESMDCSTAEGCGGQLKGQPERQEGRAEGQSLPAKGEQGREGMQAERQEESRALAEAVLTYYRQLGHMLSCAVDLRAYTKRVQGQSRSWLAQQLHAELDSAERKSCNGSQQLEREDQTGAAGGSPDMQKLLHLRRQISAYQIQHDLGLALDSAAAAEAHAIKLLKLYQHSLSLCKGLDPKEKAPGDDLIPLAVASLMAARKSDRAESTGSASTDLRDRLVQKRIMQALLVCEASQKRSAVFAASRFACTALYGLLGAAGPAAANFAALAIKHIQHDTISGHHMIPVALACQDTAALDKLLAEATQLFEDHERDAADTIMLAFDKGTFTKVIEFVEFKERLKRSHALAVARSEQSLIKIRKAIPRGFAPVQSALREASEGDAQSSGMSEDSELLSLDQLRFNEDLSTRPPWLPPCEGPVGGSLMDWWQEQHTSTHDKGYGRCWWAQPSAAELPDQGALSLRQDQQRQLHIRGLMPNVMLQLTCIQTDPNHQSAAASKETNGAAKEAVQRSEHKQGLPQLSALLGVPYCQLDSWLGSVSPSSPQLPQQWPSEEEEQDSSQPDLSRCSPSHAHQLISLAAFAAADAGKDFWTQCCQNAAEPNSTSLDTRALATTFTQRLAAVQTVFSSSCQQLIQQLKLEPDQMLLGSSLLAMVHLVSEPAVWLSLCILTWQHQFGVGGAAKKQGKKGKGVRMGAESPVHQPKLHFVREQLSHMQHAYCEGLQGVVDAVNVRLKAAGNGQHASATKAVLGDAGQHSDLVQALAGCLSWADIQAVFNSVITAQALTLKRVKLQASELISAV